MRARVNVPQCYKATQLKASSIAWNHFESSLHSAGLPTVGEEPSRPVALPLGAPDVQASRSTSPPSDTPESLDAAENTDPMHNGENSC